MLGGAIGAVVAGAIAACLCLVGVLSQPAWKLALLSGLIAAAGFFVSAAAATDTAQEAVVFLSGACLVLFATAAFTYWQLRRPIATAPVAAYTVDGSDEARYLPARGEPGGSVLTVEAPQLFSGRTYLFDCEVTLASGEAWLRLRDTQFWFPRAGFHSPHGVGANRLPNC